LPSIGAHAADEIPSDCQGHDETVLPRSSTGATSGFKDWAQA
jgi:hypothetical protein